MMSWKTRGWLWLCPIVLGIFCAWQLFAAASSHQGVPPLPPALRQGNRWVLLDFMAHWCGTCQRMKPAVASLSREIAPWVEVVHLETGDPANMEYVSRYAIAGTPTYILFNPQGEAVYRMHTFVSPVVLKAQVFRALGKLPYRALPKASADEVATWLQNLQPLRASTLPLVVAAVQGPQCRPCQQAEPVLKKIEAASPGTKVLRLEAGAETAKSWGVKRPGTYLLLDTQQKELLRLEGEEIALLPQYLPLFQTTGL